MAAEECSIGIEFFAITDPTMIASRKVQFPLSNNGNNIPKSTKNVQNKNQNELKQFYQPFINPPGLNKAFLNA